MVYGGLERLTGVTYRGMDIEAFPVDDLTG